MKLYRQSQRLNGGRTLLPLWILGLSLVVGFGQAAGHNGQPRTVQYEAIIPYLVFQSCTPIELSSILTVVNHAPEEALFEIGLVLPDGQSAGKFYREIPAHSVRRFYFGPAVTSKRWQLLPDADRFSGWAHVRSNQVLSIFQKLIVHDTRNDGASELDLTVSAGQATWGEASMSAVIDPIWDGNPLLGDPQIGWRNQTGSVALANPHNESIDVNFELDGQIETVQVPGRARIAFLIADLFPFFAPQEPGRAGTLRMTVDGEQGFGATSLKTILFLDFEKRLIPAGNRPGLRVEEPGKMRIPTVKLLESPEIVLDTMSFKQYTITLTRFGFSLVSDDGSFEKVVPLSITHLYGEGDWVTTSPDDDFAIIYLGPTMSLIFPSGAVEVLPYSGFTPPEFTRREDGLVEVRAGSPCSRVVALIDANDERIVSIDLTQDSDSFCL